MKTCSCCGRLHRSITSEKGHPCSHCSLTIDRDVNAARNIYLKNEHLLTRVPGVRVPGEAYSAVSGQSANLAMATTTSQCDARKAAAAQPSSGDARAAHAADGKSFSNGPDDESKRENSDHARTSELALQVYKRPHSKRKSDEKDKSKRGKKKRREEKDASATVMVSREHCHAPKDKKKHKKKHSRERRHRRHDPYSSESESDSRYDRRRCSRRRSSRHRSRSRSHSRSNEGETRMVPQPAHELEVYVHADSDSQEKLFEFDCAGDRDNLFFGAMYAHDQPLYSLATQRNLLTGKWISRKQPTNNRQASEDRRRTDEQRYFGLQARRAEQDARQKRLYLAYSDKRLARARATRGVGVTGGNTEMSRATEMAFIPLDPVVDVKQLVGDAEGEEGMKGRRNSDSDQRESVSAVVKELTDTQNVEQHLVERSKLFNSALAANPQDVDVWLDFVAFQEQTLRLHAKTKKLSAAVKAGVMEKQAAILARALESNPQSRELHRVRLNMSLQAQLNSASAGFEAVQKQLEQLLLTDPTNSELWIKLLQCRQQHFGSFSMQSLRDLYARTLAVLRAENASAMKDVEPESTSMSLSVQIFTPNSLLAVNNKRALPLRVQTLTRLLLDFHLLMCTFEKKAGYVERSIVQLQALIVFNLDADGKKIPVADSTASHLEMLRTFAAQWGRDDAVGFGDLSRPECEGPLPSSTAFQDFVRLNCAASLDQMNPPEAIRTEEHAQSLVSASAEYVRKSTANTASGVRADANLDADLDSKTTESVAGDELEVGEGGKLVYSNLHGYRISVDDADDAQEYERILNELRGTENAQARQQLALQKDQKKRAALVKTMSKVEDQRAKFKAVPADDRFVRWLVDEERQEQLQWEPLRSTNPLHEALIEEQPDRAILTEEIQPFLFPVPKEYRWRLVAGLLHICGVKWRGVGVWGESREVPESMYADDATDCDVLVNPILAALDPRNDGKTTESVLFLSSNDRRVLLETALLNDVSVNRGVLLDPSKVAFIRRVLAQALDVFQGAGGGSDWRGLHSAFKCLWIGFEAEVACRSDQKEAIASHARQLCQRLVRKHSVQEVVENTEAMDLDVMAAYARLELKLGNERQVRRICDKTLASLDMASPSSTSLLRVFHRLVFLRARQEMWTANAAPDVKKSASTLNRDQEHLRKLRGLFVLWSARRVQENDVKDSGSLEALTKTFRKQAARLRGHLEKLLLSDPATEEKLIAAYRADLDSAMQQCTEAQGQSDADSATNPSPRNATVCWAGQCLHNLALVVYACHGFEAACREYQRFLAVEGHQTCPQAKWSWFCYLDFMQQHQTAGHFPAVAPRAWRSAVGQAVERFPGEPLLLRLFVDAETGNTMSQVLRNHFLHVEKRWQRHFDSPELVEWLFALLCELCRVERAATASLWTDSESRAPRQTCCLFHHWEMNSTGITRIRQVFEGMVDHVRTRGNALCWRLYLRFEVALGKVDAAKKVFYRGISACAWSKALFLDGIRVLRAYLSDDECLELMEFMAAKELHVRVDFAE